MPLSSTNRQRMIRRFGGWSLFVVISSIMIPLAMFTGCQSRLIYFPRPYPPGLAEMWAKETPGKVIDFTTSQGHQRAFLQGRLTQPRNLWLVCGGNGAVALDWSDWLRANAPREDAWLLIDYPGYGDCHGSPAPATIRESFKQVMPVAMRELGWSGDTDPSRLRILGHSLGAAACLIAAADHHIQRGVLIAPFTSTMDMAREVTGLPLGFLVRHRFDNSARLRDLAGHGAGRIIILHGVQDEVVPVRMSRQLAKDQPALVELREIENGRHNTIEACYPADLAKALREAGN